MEHVTPERVTLGKPGMIEVILRAALHPELLHDAERATIGRHGERNDLGEREPIEAESERGARGFRRVATALMRGGQAPADFHARSEVRLEAREREADEARERRDTGNLQRPEAEAVLVEVRLDAVCEGIALLAR